MYRVALGAFDFDKDEATSARDAVDKLISTLREIAREDSWDQLCYTVDNLETDEHSEFDLAKGDSEDD